MEQQKLNEKQERKQLIIELHNKGLSYREIGEQLCITKQRVHQIINQEFKTHFSNYACVYPKIKDFIVANHIEIRDLENATGIKGTNIRNELLGTQNMSMKLGTYFEQAIGQPLDIILQRGN